MDDSELVTAIAAGDPAGLAAAYDKYAAPLYGYCRWMLRDSGDAAEVLSETFVIAAANAGGLKDASQLRARLYATARAECYRRLDTAEAAFDETAGTPASPTDAGARDDAGAPASPTAGAPASPTAGAPASPTAGGKRRTEQAEVRQLILATLAELKPQEHELIELSIRHNLDETELAVVFDVSWSRAHALASRAHEHLEKALGTLLIARTGRQCCPELSALLADWDGRLTMQLRKLTAPHIEHCETCAHHRHGTLRPEMLARLMPLAALPPGLREPILRDAAASPSSDGKTRSLLIRRPGAPGPAGFQRARAFLSWSGIRSNPGPVTAIAAVTAWVVAAMGATLIAIAAGHAARALAVPSHSAPSPAASTRAADARASAIVTPHRSRRPKPTARPTPTAVPTFVPRPSPTASPKPTASKSASPSPSASSSGSASPSASASPSPSRTPKPTPTPTPTHT